jgi:hypothetical protein
MTISNEIIDYLMGKSELRKEYFHSSIVVCYWKDSSLETMSLSIAYKYVNPTVQILKSS